jgi:hypothetical protein
MLKRELAKQRLADTAVSDHFPTNTIYKVKKYIGFAMGLKVSELQGQIINRKGLSVLHKERDLY